MTASLVGQVSIGQVVPTTASLVATAATDIGAKLAGALETQVAVTLTPPSLTGSITAATNLLASLEAQLAMQIALGLPEVSVDFTVMLSVIAELQASLSALLALQVTLGTAGVYVITHSGAASTHASEVQAIVDGIAPPGNVVQSVTYLATAPEVFVAMGAVLLTG
jgi:hypothetical protein